MLTDDQITRLQFAIDDSDSDTVRELLKGQSSDYLTELQFYGNSTLLMYALQRSSPETVQVLLELGVRDFELPFSDNNELKSALRNKKAPLAMLELALGMLPPDVARDMIESDWDPEETGNCESAMEMARSMKNPACREKLERALNG